MKKYYKVYANCCRAVNPISEIQVDDIRKEIRPLVDQVTESDRFLDLDLDWDNQFQVQDAIERIYETAFEILDDYEILNCGDFCIIVTEGVPRTRPNKCGFDTELILD